MDQKFTGNAIRETYIQFFLDKGHTFVPSAPLIPGDDETLLFTNAGMVQFKDIFLGTDKRAYTRATNSQKCLRVSGKHNDLEEVGQDNTHHTFFEMLGNWSFGDYYKKEAIAWAWELLTDVWGLPKDRVWATCFKDEYGEIPTDEEAAGYWKQQPGMEPEHVLFFGRKDNLWEMAETGPCGPCSEIHFDRGESYCTKGDEAGHVCEVNGDCERFLELWNLVFIQYNRISSTDLQPLPATHVDTGMGFERIVSVLQDVDSNYKTDLLRPLIEKTQELSGQTDEERENNLTPYRVIADHVRASAFLIADGVVPGNLGRNYVCRMIIRRAARFGTKIGLTDPFMAPIAESVIEMYGEAYPELGRNRGMILESITKEEERFQRTVESSVAHLMSLLDTLEESKESVLNGDQAFELYATYGLPLEITRDIAQERGLDVDQDGFDTAMEAHRVASGAGRAFGEIGGADVAVYRPIIDQLQKDGALGEAGVQYDPYGDIDVEGVILALVKDGKAVKKASEGDQIEVLLPATPFYVEAGGQITDTGRIISKGKRKWEIRVEGTSQPAAGVIVHFGQVLKGEPKVGDDALASVDGDRRQDIMRNHTATHLLHSELHRVLGEHARQAGSLVAPDRLRFDFTHTEALTEEQLTDIEMGVNQHILDNYPLEIAHKPLQQAIDEGAIALFGEKYEQDVRTITIGGPEPFSYELCGGTHVDETGDIGLFLIVSEGSIAAGVRRIEAVTGRRAYDLMLRRMKALKESGRQLGSAPEAVSQKTAALLEELNAARKEINKLRQEMSIQQFNTMLTEIEEVSGVPVMAVEIPYADADTLRQLGDRFRQKHPTGVAVLASVTDERPMIVAVVTKDLTERGLHAGELVKHVAKPVGGSGGGRPTLAQAGGKDAAKLKDALAGVTDWVKQHLK